MTLSYFIHLIHSFEDWTSPNYFVQGKMFLFTLFRFVLPTYSLLLNIIHHQQLYMFKVPFVWSLLYDEAVLFVIKKSVTFHYIVIMLRIRFLSQIRVYLKNVNDSHWNYATGFNTSWKRSFIYNFFARLLHVTMFYVMALLTRSTM